MTDYKNPVDFADLGLSAKVLSSVKETGYTSPTPIQAGAIPAVLQHKDVLGIAQTGTGKTASFVLPMLTLLESGRARIRMPRTIIIAPTRELAAQIAENFEKYGKNHKLNIVLLIGGVSFEEQERKLERGADVLIATPGRMLDHHGRGKILLNGVEILVIDEADRMLDMGFIPDIERICKLIPMTRQTLLFSATMPGELEILATKFLHNPERIEVAAASSTAQTITQYLVPSDKKLANKRHILRDLIKSQNDTLKNAIIFCNRKRDVSELFRSMQRHGFSVGALHGDMDQRSRSTTLDNFRQDKLQLLVASDVAARGLDIPDVSHVFNFDVPTHAEDYVHRIGRTGRAGRTGVAFTLVTKNDTKSLEAIEKIIGKTIPYLDKKQLAELKLSENISEETPTSSEKTEKKKTPARKSVSRKQKPAKSEEKAGANISESLEKLEPSNSHRKNQEKKRMPSHNAKTDEKLSVGTHSRKTEKHDKSEVIGFGDDVPAFMRIPTQ